jgi:hypothetical protein
VKKKSSAPHSRLACVHLQNLLARNSPLKKQSNSTVRAVKEKTQKDQRAKNKK